MAGTPAEGRHPQPTVITDAKTGASEEFSSRQRNYIIAMGVRTVCFLLSTILYFTHLINGWVCGILFVAAVVLPSVAVVLANQANTRTKDAGRIEHGSPAPADAPQLTSGPEPEVISGTVEDEDGPVAEPFEGPFGQKPDRHVDHTGDRGAA